MYTIIYYKREIPISMKTYLMRLTRAGLRLKSLSRILLIVSVYKSYIFMGIAMIDHLFSENSACVVSIMCRRR